MPSLFFNYMSLLGALLILVGLGSGVLTLLLDITSLQAKAYTGVLFIVYLFLILVGGMVIPIGMLRERARRRPGGAPSLTADLVIDLRRPSHRNTILAFMVAGAVVALAMTVGSYQTYQATESNLFCGQVCHQVMKPEATAYQYSSHARVKCVECHIGSGAGWYVRSKISGIRQVFAVTFNTYPRPIPTPISNLRPARETCEECHWPQKFIGYKEILRTYFLGDEKSTPYRIRMLMKIGGEENSLMRGSGIHYHMLLANKVEYIARDEDRQDIAWVRITHSDGTVEVYNDQDNPLTDAQRAKLNVRRMDCMDCHNRPSHKFPTPMHIVDQALDVGAIPRDLPYIKVESVKALDENYANTPAAMQGIDDYLRDYYKDEYPEVLKDKSKDLDKAVSELQAIYKRTVFPEMKASWAKYPDNIGHRDFPGCFRCHNDRLATEDDKTIFTACNKCHLIIAQGQDVDEVKADFTEGLPFKHPGDDGDTIEDYTDCTECHSGGKAVYD
ncbi:MAG TPA: NapC/NirT family cytochrome c [bacterium]|nr:NapC/NirT family cytochrome c [bacterium]